MLLLTILFSQAQQCVGSSIHGEDTSTCLKCSGNYVYHNPYNTRISPNKVYMVFIWLSQEMGIMILYTINWWYLVQQTQLFAARHKLNVLTQLFREMAERGGGRSGNTTSLCFYVSTISASEKDVGF
jgi:hypothetical protein